MASSNPAGAVTVTVVDHYSGNLFGASRPSSGAAANGFWFIGRHNDPCDTAILTSAAAPLHSPHAQTIPRSPVDRRGEQRDSDGEKT